MSEEHSLSALGAYVPFPAFLLDELMPHLKDTEWRLLCIIVRQTLGWRSGAGRKKRDWMSQKQLITRSGRSSAALSEAVDALVGKNLIQCSDEKGGFLMTPGQRRQHRGHMYFALSPTLWGQKEQQTANTSKGSHTDVSAHRHESPSPTTLVPQRIYTGWTQASVVAQTRKQPVKSEVQKAKWTKETEAQKKL